MTPVAVRPDQVDLWLSRIGDLLRSCCRGGDTTPERLAQEVRATERQMWLVVSDSVDCLVLTNIANDELKTCRVTHCAGHGRENWLHLFPVIEMWAREIGCERIEATTRPGWERPLSEFGLKKTHIVLEKRLRDG